MVGAGTCYPRKYVCSNHPKGNALISMRVVFGKSVFVEAMVPCRAWFPERERRLSFGRAGALPSMAGACFFEGSSALHGEEKHRCRYIKIWEGIQGNL